MPPARAHGRVSTPPLVHEAVLAEPLCFNPIAADEVQPHAGSQHVALRRTRDEGVRTLRDTVARVLAEEGFVLMRDIQQFLAFASRPDGSIAAHLD